MTQDLPVVTVLHQLPGRLRLRLNPGSGSPRRLTAAVRGHPGIFDQKYDPRTRSLLIIFDPTRISSRELVFRAALALSLEVGGSPVLLREAETAQPSPNLVILSGATLGIAGLARFSRAGPATLQVFDWTAGFVSVAAIIHHGWNEARNRGSFDPEVLSVFYLLTAMAGGGFLRAAFLTWAATFVRHWVVPADEGALLRPVMSLVRGKPRIREVRLEPSPLTDRATRLFDLFRTLLRTVLAAHAPGNLLGDFRALSRTHGRLLEGLGGSRREVIIRVD